MWVDEIVEEMRTQRQAWAERFDYDLDAMSEDMREREQRTDRPVVSFVPKRPARLVVKRKAHEAASR